MNPDPSVIGKIYKSLSSKIKNLDERLMQQLQPTVQKFDKLRFDFFKQCYQDTKDSAKCYYQGEKYDLQVDFQGAAKTFEECISKASLNKSWQQPADTCFKSYEQALRSNIQSQISRVLKLA